MISASTPQLLPLKGKERFNVLVIDDNTSFRQYIQRFLEITGLKVVTANTGEDGLRLAKGEKPDLIFLDLCLGFKSRLSGSQTIRALKADPDTRFIPIIAMSGIKDGPEDELQIRRDGADEFMAKAEISLGSPETSPFMRRVSALLMLNLTREGNPSSSRDSLGGGAEHGPYSEGAPGLKFTLLVIDDEEETSQLIQALVNKDPAYRVISAGNGAQGLRMAASEFPDAIVLDLIMPGMSGQEVCKRLREQEKIFYVPILILTADMRVEHEIDCINLGADDYVTRPIHIGRLMARIRGLIRRSRFRGNSKGVIKIGAISLDLPGRRLAVAGREPIELTPTECALCALLMSAEGKVVDKKVLYKKLYNSWPSPDSAAIKSHVCRIREKLEDLGGLIDGRKEDGYRFNIERARSLSG